MLNINYGKNQQLMDACEPLKEYAWLVETVRQHQKEKMDLDVAVSRLKLLKASHLSQRYALEDQIIKEFPQKISSYEQRIEGYRVPLPPRPVRLYYYTPKKRIYQ